MNSLAEQGSADLLLNRILAKDYLCHSLTQTENQTLQGCARFPSVIYTCKVQAGMLSSPDLNYTTFSTTMVGKFEPTLGHFLQPYPTSSGCFVANNSATTLQHCIL